MHVVKVISLSDPAYEAIVRLKRAAELLEGAERSGRSAAERSRVEEFLQHIRLLPFGPKAARAYARWAAPKRGPGRSAGLMDMLIAAMGVVEGATIVTRNRTHFEGIEGVPVRDSW